MKIITIRFLIGILTLFILASSPLFGQRTFNADEPIGEVWGKTIETVRFRGSLEKINEQVSLFKKYKHINHAIISNPTIEAIPEKLFNFPRLSRLEFEACDKMQFGHILRQVKQEQPHLVSIIFRDMDFSQTVFDRQDAPKYLEELSFINCTGINNRLDSLVSFLEKREDSDLFKKFQYLRLDECSIRSDDLPKSFQMLKKLASLSLVKNELDSLNTLLPEKLVQLDISYNRFNHFPIEMIEKLWEIKFLSIDCNLLDSTEIMKVLEIDRIEKGRCRGKNKLKSYTYSCNTFKDQQGIEAISQKLDCAVVWRTGIKLPINDFRPLSINCEECISFRYKALLGEWAVVKINGNETRLNSAEEWNFNETTIEFKTSKPVPYANQTYNYQLRELANSDFLAIQFDNSPLPECLLKINPDGLIIIIPEGEKVRELKFER